MIDWDDAFDNSGYVTDAQAYGARWAAAAAAFRDPLLAQGRAHVDQPYGARDRETYDLFHPAGPARGTMIFVHGGYWRLFDKSYWSHLAHGCVEKGWTVAIPSYPLAPATRISQITDAIARAVTQIAAATQGPIVLVGHSAGGHLVARMLCDGVREASVVARLRRVVSVSGVHHLDPLLGIKLNAELNLTPQEAHAESPVHLDPVTGVPVTVVVGGQERPEFLRQTRMIAEVWGLKGVDVRSVYDTDKHHFNVVETLAEPDGTLVQEALR